MRRPTAGWTPSPTGAAPRAFRPPRSPGERGPRSAARQALAESADTAITPDEGAYAFQALLRHDRAYTGYAPMIGDTVADRLRATQPIRRSVQVRGAKPKGIKRIPGRAESAAPGRVAHPAATLISDQISRILRRSVDPDRPLSEYGVDSLGNLELRTRIETETGIRITSTDITTVRGLAELSATSWRPQRSA